jgi:hypothetical protein
VIGVVLEVCSVTIQTESTITSEDIFGVYKNSSKSEKDARWRKVAKENKKVFMFSGSLRSRGNAKSPAQTEEAAH